MLYAELCGNKVSRLGFGTMRLPKCEDGTIDAARTQYMIDLAMEHGVNYFDTAWPYHESRSEIVVGECLKKYPRESFFLADKYPGHQTADTYEPAVIFEKQLEKCQVEYFDYYLLHNVCEYDEAVYEDPKWGIIDYFLEQKRLGRIRHLGFSSHGGPQMLERFLSKHREELEFCQIQINYLDWTLQEAEKKYEILKAYDMPVIVMEPLRGGKLADDVNSAFRFLKDLDGCKVILSGMSAEEQMEENIRIFSEEMPLREAERMALLEKAEALKKGVPCTGCRYCCEGCPMELDIPLLMGLYNDMSYASTFAPAMQMDSLPKDKRASACIGCGACAAVCPQTIEIPAVMRKLDELYRNGPNWTKICEERAKAAAKE